MSRVRVRARRHGMMVCMDRMWVTGPENYDPDRLRAIEAEGARVQAEVDAIERSADESACRICGTRDELTDEHAPSRRAGNIGRLVRGMIDYAASVVAGEVAWRAEELHGGAKAASLCRRCNNATGRWYNPAYIRLAEACRPAAVPENAGRICEVTVPVVHQQRVAKQALTSVLATSQAGVVVRYPHLRGLLLDAEATRRLAPLRLWLYLRANPGGRTSGVASSINIESRVGRVFAEFSFWPLGWVLTFDDVRVEGATDVSPWFEVGFHEKDRVTLSVRCQWAVTPYPVDFRSPEMVLAEGVQGSRPDPARGRYGLRGPSESC